VVVASDVSHFYENMESGRPVTTAFHVGQMLEGFDRLFALAPTRAHIVPGHDPEVMRRYPAPWPELEGIVVRLDVAPNQGSQPGITWRTACLVRYCWRTPQPPPCGDPRRCPSGSTWCSLMPSQRGDAAIMASNRLCGGRRSRYENAR
jgi:hypothetical protein